MHSRMSTVSFFAMPMRSSPALVGDPLAPEFLVFQKGRQVCTPHFLRPAYPFRYFAEATLWARSSFMVCLCSNFSRAINKYNWLVLRADEFNRLAGALSDKRSLLVHELDRHSSIPWLRAFRSQNFDFRVRTQIFISLFSIAIRAAVWKPNQSEFEISHRPFGSLAGDRQQRLA